MSEIDWEALAVQVNKGSLPCAIGAPWVTDARCFVCGRPDNLSGCFKTDTPRSWIMAYLRARESCK